MPTRYLSYRRDNYPASCLFLLIEQGPAKKQKKDTPNATVAPILRLVEKSNRPVDNESYPCPDFPEDSAIIEQRDTSPYPPVMAAEEEICEQAFHDYEKPLISYGRPYTEICRKHAEKTFNASRIYIIASGSLSKNTTALKELEKALDGRIVGTRIGMSPHTLMNECLEVMEDVRCVDADLIVTLGGGSLSDASKLVAYVSSLSFHYIRPNESMELGTGKQHYNKSRNYRSPACNGHRPRRNKASPDSDHYDTN